ncbi:MAG TPA: dTDP-4-dehydrorhamnose reductase [Pseudonocardiaceae bacterium]
MTALLVTGARGQLGTDLLAAAAAAGVTAHGLGSDELDVTDAQRVRDTVTAFAAAHPDAVVVNAAAHTAVDAAETDADRAYAVNAVGPGLLSAACAEHGVPIVHVSTDYVFPGTASAPYEVDAPTGPRSVYGRTKLAGERAVLSASVRGYVVRTAWVYGATGSNFVKTMARLESAHETVTVVDDQHGSPTWSADLAAGLVELALATDRVPPGVLHCTNGGATTWYEFARAVFAELGADPERVRPCSSDAFARPAPRPAYSVLSPTAWAEAGLTPLRPWRDALAAAFVAARPAFAGVRTG